MSSTLYHLYPDLEMIAQELNQEGIACTCAPDPDRRHFRGVRFYSSGQPQEDILYVLRPQQVAQFPEGRCFVSTVGVSGKPGSIFCPELTAEQLLDQLLELFLRWQIMERELDELVYRCAGLHELCELGAKFLGNPICIHDDWFIMTAMSQELPQIMPPEYIMSSSAKFVPRVIVEDFQYDTDYLETYSHRTAQLWRASPDGPKSLYVNLWDGEVYQGRLLVVQYHREFRAADYMIAECLTQRAALLLQRRRLGESGPYRSMDDVVFDLLSGRKPDPADEAQLMTMLDWNKTDKLTCIRAKSQQDSPTLVMEHVLHSDLFRIFPNSYIMFEGHQQCIVVNITKEQVTLSQLRHRMSPLCRDFCLYAGISSPVSGTRELHVAYHQADIALNRAFRLRGDRWVIPFSDCALDYMLSSLQTPLSLNHIAAPELRLLMDIDKEKGTQYFDTLRTFLLLERDIPKTSAALIVHRTTLLYRLKKIQAITELNLDDPQQRLYLLLSLRILEQEHSHYVTSHSPT